MEKVNQTVQLLLSIMLAYTLFIQWQTTNDARLTLAKIQVAYDLELKKLDKLAGK